MMGMHLCMVEKISKHIVPICVQCICLIAENLQQSYHTCSPWLLCSIQHQNHQLTSTVTAAKTEINNKLAGFKCSATVNRNKTNKISERALCLQPSQSRGKHLIHCRSKTNNKIIMLSTDGSNMIDDQIMSLICVSCQVYILKDPAGRWFISL